MSPATLQCPACGAPAAHEATRCEYCGASLATVACPSCFGMMFRGAQFCSHCGAKAQRTETAATEQLCPRCQENMHAVTIGSSNLQECPQCAGIWADAASLEHIGTEREKQAAVLSLGATSPETALAVEQKIRYLPCPVCHKLMNRTNFARCSRVIVDVCKGHGTWFDKDELRRSVEFIRAGGLEKARAKELANLEEQRERLRAEQHASMMFNDVRSSRGIYDDSKSAGGGIAGFLLSLLDR